MYFNGYRKERKDEDSPEYRDYPATFTDLARFAETVHGHWTIGNKHCVLDVQFGEDGHSAQELLGGSSGFDAAHGAECHPLRRPLDTPLAIRKLWASLNDDYRSEPIFGKAPP